MKKHIFTILGVLWLSSSVWAYSLKLTVATTGTVSNVAGTDCSGLLFKFDVPTELQNVRIDAAFLRFKVQTDTSGAVGGLLMRPVLTSWTSGATLSSLSDSAISSAHVSFGKVNFGNGTAKVEISPVLKAWQAGELNNFGLLIYPANKLLPTLQLQTQPGSGAAELEITYTPQEKK